MALFSELGSSPATMEAGKAVDAYGSQPGFVNQQNDGAQAYTQALMDGVGTRLPVDRWPKSWVGKYRRPVVVLIRGDYGKSTVKGCSSLWGLLCLIQKGGRLSAFTLTQASVGSVCRRPQNVRTQESIAKGWELIASKIDMDVPTDIGRYLGCDHLQEYQVKLNHLFDKSLSDPAAKEAAAAQRTQDFWEVDAPKGVYIRHHCQPRKGYYIPEDEIFDGCDLSNIRFTDVAQCSSEDETASEWDTFRDYAGGVAQGKRRPSMWVGVTYLFTKSCKDPKNALATIKRDKNPAKKKARAQGSMFSLYGPIV